jgi:hypothetical protein
MWCAVAEKGGLKCSPGIGPTGGRRYGTATVRDSSFTDNSAILQGGGLENIGTATVSDSRFRRNTAGSGNGGLNNETGGLLTQFDKRFINDQRPDVFPCRRARYDGNR